MNDSQLIYKYNYSEKENNFKFPKKVTNFAKQLLKTFTWDAVVITMSTNHFRGNERFIFSVRKKIGLYHEFVMENNTISYASNPEDWNNNYTLENILNK